MTPDAVGVSTWTPFGCGRAAPATNFEGNLVYHSEKPHFEGGAFIPGDNPSIDGFNPWTDNILLKTDAPAPELVEVFRALAGLEPAYRRAILGGDVPLCQSYRLIETSRADDVWSAQQFHWPEKNAGVVLAFRRIKCEEPTRVVRLRALDPDAHYELTGVGPKPPQTASGKSLMERGLTVEIGKKPTDSMIPNYTVLMYHKQ